MSINQVQLWILGKSPSHPNVNFFIKKLSYPSHVNGNSHCVTGTTTPIATNYY
jgi:hypothetical protein